MVLVSNCPQLNNPCNGWDPTALDVEGAGHERHRHRRPGNRRPGTRRPGTRRPGHRGRLEYPGGHRPPRGGAVAPCRTSAGAPATGASGSRRPGPGTAPACSWPTSPSATTARAAGLEWVVTGPTLRFADRRPGLRHRAPPPVPPSTAGRCVRGPSSWPGPAPCSSPGRRRSAGMRGYLAVSGGLDVPVDLGSRSTFLLGTIGGYAGRALAADDRLPLGRAENRSAPLDVTAALPVLGNVWELRVLPGPHGAPEHLTGEGVAELLAATWAVDHRADRTGVRLVGPDSAMGPDRRRRGRPAPVSNIHDSAYPVGGIMLSGDTPVIVGPDGPSLGGFVVPAATVARRPLEARPAPPRRQRPAGAGDPRGGPAADRGGPHLAPRPRAAAGVRAAPDPSAGPRPDPVGSHPDLRPLAARHVRSAGLDVTIRASGDRHLLVEAGDPVLDLRVRVWVGLLESRAAAGGARRPHRDRARRPLAADRLRPGPGVRGRPGRGRGLAHRLADRAPPGPSSTVAR